MELLLPGYSPDCPPSDNVLGLPVNFWRLRSVGTLYASGCQPKHYWMLCSDWARPWVKRGRTGDNSSFRCSKLEIYASFTYYQSCKVLARRSWSSSNTCSSVRSLHRTWKWLRHATLHCSDKGPGNTLATARCLSRRYRRKIGLQFCRQWLPIAQ